MEKLIEKIIKDSETKSVFIVAIDGRCASGKTTLASEISKVIDCNIVHTDDFFLQPFQRTEERYNEAGGNLDRERLLKEVIVPLRKGESISYRPFLCHSLSLGEEIRLPEKRITLVEGSYSCHPELRAFYDMTVFVTVDKETQRLRILERNGEEKLKAFEEKWIPLEERYFEEYTSEYTADVVVKAVGSKRFVF